MTTRKQTNGTTLPLVLERHGGKLNSSRLWLIRRSNKGSRGSKQGARGPQWSDQTHHAPLLADQRAEQHSHTHTRGRWSTSGRGHTAKHFATPDQTPDVRTARH